jgi:hypothetical protein
VPKLCQINALVKGRKSEIEKFVGDLYKIVQKPDLFSGLERNYQPKDENGDKLPPERKRAQFKVKDLLEQAQAKWTELWDLVATQDNANREATADIVVDGATVLKDVPVTTLLFLEKQVTDLQTFLEALPTPDLSEEWHYDANTGLLRGRPTETVRTKKEPTHYTKAEATKEHQAQVEFFHKDVPTGTWTNTQFSGAVPADQKAEMVARVKKLKDAIKIGREEANTRDAKQMKVSDQIFKFVLGK